MGAGAIGLRLEEERMARLKIRFLLAAALVFSSGGLFLATAAPAAGAAAAPAAAGGTICIAHHELRQGHRVRAGGTGHDSPSSTRCRRCRVPPGISPGRPCFPGIAGCRWPARGGRPGPGDTLARWE